MRYVVEHDGKYLKVFRKGWNVARTWVALSEASTWAKPGHAKQASNLAGGEGKDVVVWGVQVVLVESAGTHRARKPR
jgi:hypothetical protein